MVKLLYGLYSANNSNANYRNYADLVHVYLHYPSAKVARKCTKIMLANLEECLPIIKKLLPNLTGQRFGKGTDFLSQI